MTVDEHNELGFVSVSFDDNEFSIRMQYADEIEDAHQLFIERGHNTYLKVVDIFGFQHRFPASEIVRIAINEPQSRQSYSEYVKSRKLEQVIE
jgi:hypothetical protein